MDNFVTTSSQQQAAADGLIQTETTDAVNSGIVGSADKTLSAAKKGVSSVAKKAATNAAENYLHKHTSSPTGLQSVKDQEKIKAVSKAGSVEAAEEQASHHLANAVNSKAKSGAKSAASIAVAGTLQNSEIEGVDDLYYKSRRGVRLGKKVVHLFTKKKTATEVSTAVEKNAKNAAKKSVQATKQNQSQSYMRKSINKARRKAQASTAKSASTKAAAAGKGKAVAAGGGKLAGITGGALAILIAFLLFGLFGIVIAGGMAGSEEVENSQPMEGFPEWMTFDFFVGALEAQEQYGYPASGLLAQMIKENGASGRGSSLGWKYHNYSGIKCISDRGEGWVTGCTPPLLTKEVDSTGSGYHDEMARFAVFASNRAFMNYRAKYLLQQRNYTIQPDYQSGIAKKDGALFVRGLMMGGYGGRPEPNHVNNYVADIQSIIDSHPLLQQLNSMTSAQFVDYMNNQGGVVNNNFPIADLPPATPKEQAIVNAAYTTPSAGAGLCATWVQWVYQRAGVMVHHGNGNSILAGDPTSTDWSKIRPGQIISIQHGNAGSQWAGWYYGHTGIYVGNGKVRHSTGGKVHEESLNAFVTRHQKFGWVVYGSPTHW